MTRKPQELLYRDAQSLIKLVLTELETSAVLPPIQACEPMRFDEARRRIVRRIWDFYRDATAEDET
jgi:hypothetical protein